MTDPKVWPSYFDQPGGTLIHFGEPNLIPRYIHFVVSSVAMGGLTMGLLGWWRGRKDGPDGGATMVRGLRVYAGATLFQFVGLGVSECESCEFCSLFCPDLCITRDGTSGSVLIDLDYCKGCGICASVCPKGAIQMVLEESS